MDPCVNLDGQACNYSGPGDDRWKRIGALKGKPQDQRGHTGEEEQVPNNQAYNNIVKIHIYSLFVLPGLYVLPFH